MRKSKSRNNQNKQNSEEFAQDPKETNSKNKRAQIQQKPIAFDLI